MWAAAGLQRLGGCQFRIPEAMRVIVSASYRTDIPAFYADWLIARLRAGTCRVANPYGGGAYQVALTPAAVDGFVLWTRNLRPLLPRLDEVRRVAPFVVQFTLTGYPRALESSVIAPEDAVEQLRELRRRWGPRAAVWRYDPIVFAAGLDERAHADGFAALAAALAGTVDEVALSCMNPYRKTRRNLDRAGRRHGFAWHDPPADEKRALLARLAAIAAEHGIAATLCSQPQLLAPGLGEARCIDAERLADVGQCPLAARESGNRPGCRCAQSRDIGAYDGCPHGCVYCYAVTDRDRAVANFRAHDPAAESLGG
jgi:hypothetical protein